MMNFRKIAAASKGKFLLRYFTESAPEPVHPPGIDPANRALEDGGRLVSYYTGRDARGTWRPDMPKIFARAVGVDPTRAPQDAQMTRLFEGRRADTGEKWAGGRRVFSGFDIVFSPHKSVSLAAEFAPTPAETALLWNAADRAADRAMRYLAHEVGYARKGRGGEDGADPGAVGWITFRHSTARPTVKVQDGPGGATYVFDAPVAGDPHMHFHNFLMNLVATAEGRIGSLDTKVLSDARVKEFGAYFQAVLADELRRLGVRVEYDKNEQAIVISKVPERANSAFSKGRRQVVNEAKEYAQRQGFVWDELSAEAKLDILRDAGVAGRLGKMKTDEKRIWREQAKKLGWTHESVLEETTYQPLSDEERFEKAYQFAARRLAEEFRTAAVITREKLGLYATRGLIGVGISEGPKDIKRVVELLEERGIRLNGEHVALVTGLFHGGVSVTNTAQVRIEQSLADLAHASVRDRSGALSVAQIRAALAESHVAFTAQQRAAIHALGEGGALTMLTGAAGVGKTTLLQPLVSAWKADTKFDPEGREVIGVATAWRQADALKDAGIERTYAISPLLGAIERGEFDASRNTVLVLDEASQIGPRPLLRLLELQAKTGMTIKMLGDREQAQAIEAGDSIEILRRALPPEALPELLTTIRQATERHREIAGLFREGEAKEALLMKRADGHARLLGGDRQQVIDQVADLYIARRDILLGSGSKHGISVSAPTNEDAAEISEAIRKRLKARGEITGEELVYQAIDQNGREYDLALARGDRVRLYRRTWGAVNGRACQVGNNGDVVEVLGQSTEGLTIRTKDGKIATVEWRRFADPETGRLLLGLGHALTISASQGLTSDEHINALASGTSGVSAFTTYVAESRARGTTWTLISEGALYEAERLRRALGDATPITHEDLWARAAKDMSDKPYKELGIDLMAAALRDRERAIDTFIATNQTVERAKLKDPKAGPKALARLQAAAIEKELAKHLKALDHAIAENEKLRNELARSTDALHHLSLMRVEARKAAERLRNAEPTPPAPRHSGPSM